MDMPTASPNTRLLLVDDDHIDRLACRRALEQSGHPFSIIEAETAEQGLWLARHEPVDCIVLDHFLPDFCGLEFLADLVEERGELPIPVVMLTCANDASVAVRALQLGASDYVVKDSGRESLAWLPAIIFKTLEARKALRKHRETEEELRRAEAKYRTLVEQIPAITYVASIEEPGRLLYVSPQAERLGHPVEACLEAPEGLLQWMHPDDREQAIEALARTHEHHAPLCCEYRLATGDGRMLWFRDQASVVYAGNGQALFVQGILVDITADKAAGQELRLHRRPPEESLRTLWMVEPDAGSQSVGTPIAFIHPESRRGKPAEAALPDNAAEPSEGVLLVMRDAMEVRPRAAQPSDATRRDALTGLPTRAEFERKMGKLLSAAREEHTGHALCFLDLDRFRQVNDTFGHAAGDRLLLSLVRLLESRLRRSDTLARLGGDEFGLLLERCGLEQAWIIANDLREAVGEYRFPWGGEELSVGLSVGIVLLHGAGSGVAEALSAADTACYIAKKRGRNRVHVLQGMAYSLPGEPPAALALGGKRLGGSLNLR